MSKRERTERRIQYAALRLAAQEGIDAVTVEAICAAADVSERTFFNYFLFKDAVFAVAPPPLPEDSVKAFLTNEGTLLEALTQLIGDQVAQIADDADMATVLRDIMYNHPRVAALQITRMHAFDRELAALIARRLGREADDHACLVLAAATNAATRIAIEYWTEKGTSDVRGIVARSLGELLRLATRDTDSISVNTANTSYQ